MPGIRCQSNHAVRNKPIKSFKEGSGSDRVLCPDAKYQSPCEVPGAKSRQHNGGILGEMSAGGAVDRVRRGYRIWREKRRETLETLYHTPAQEKNFHDIQIIFPRSEPYIVLVCKV